MSSPAQVEMGIRKITGFIVKFYLIIAFTLTRWIVYVLTFIAVMLVIEQIVNAGAGNPVLDIMGNIVGLAAALFGMLLGLIQMMTGLLFGNQVMAAKGISIIGAGGSAAIGHLVVGMLDTIMAPFWLVFKSFNIIMSQIMDESSLRYDANGDLLGPKVCNGRYPDYRFGDIKGLKEVFDFKIKVDLEKKVCTADIIGDAAGSRKDAYCTNIGYDFNSKQMREYEPVKSIANAGIFPEWALDLIFGVIEGSLSFIVSDYSGYDILRHYTYVDPLNFDNNGNLEGGQGSHPFDSYFDNKVQWAMGCP